MIGWLGFSVVGVYVVGFVWSRGWNLGLSFDVGEVCLWWCDFIFISVVGTG